MNDASLELSDPISCWYIEGFIIVHVRLCSFEDVKSGHIFVALQTRFKKPYCVFECISLIKFKKSWSGLMKKTRCEKIGMCQKFYKSEMGFEKVGGVQKFQCGRQA